MKKGNYWLLIVLFILSSCSLTSRTTIGPKKAFELGDGQHGYFKVVIKNVSEVPIEICTAASGQPSAKILTLAPGQKRTVRVAANTKAIFKNNSDKEGALDLKVTGDTGLSMGGPDY